MTRRIYLGTGLAAVVILQLISGGAIAQTTPLSAPDAVQSDSSDRAIDAQEELAAPVEQPSDTNLTPSAQAPVNEAAPVCLGNQFASSFSDVPPDHWAFEAVNRLAIEAPRCFPVQS